MNPNPRIGVLLKIYGASVRLYNCLNPRAGMMGLKRFNREWPAPRLLREMPGFGAGTLREWNRLLAERERKGSDGRKGGGK